MRIEVIPLVVNICCFTFYAAVSRPIQPGKLFYWCGATLLTIGLLLMKG
jgi:hypothetical protein